MQRTGTDRPPAAVDVFLKADEDPESEYGMFKNPGNHPLRAIAAGGCPPEMRYIRMVRARMC